jgi:hypothetical protein
LAVTAFTRLTLADLLTDMFQTYNMVNWVHSVPTRDVTKMEMMRAEAEGDVMHPDFGLPWGYKIFVTTVVLGSKLAIAIAIFVASAPAVSPTPTTASPPPVRIRTHTKAEAASRPADIVLSETNNDLIMNSMAVAFVNEIDELVFAFTTRSAHRDHDSPSIQP